ncbi:MAG: glucose-1-phosphate cytidylyltransferase [Erysipelotrichaceae bacterium]
MKVVILAGGLGTRISEESHLKPKPMIEIDGMPIMWHIMKYYSSFGFNDFIICGGYKDYKIKEFFANYYLHTSDMTFDLENNDLAFHSNNSEKWKITCVNTGLNTMTGGRIKRIQEHIQNESFLLTYGDGLSDVNLTKLINEHQQSKATVTMTAIQPGGRFGVLEIEESGTVSSFAEKNKEDGGWINGGFMVCNPEVFDYIQGDEMTFEKEPLEQLAKQGKLHSYKHEGFWQCMDTLRDKELLEKLIRENKAPWMVW